MFINCRSLDLLPIGSEESFHLALNKRGATLDGQPWDLEGVKWLPHMNIVEYYELLAAFRPLWMDVNGGRVKG